MVEVCLKKKRLLSLSVSFCLFGNFSVVFAGDLSFRSCIHNLRARCNKHDINYPMERGTALEKTINYISEILQERELGRLSLKVDEDLKRHLFENMSDVAFELRVCFRYTQDLREVFSGLQNMRKAYIRIYRQYQGTGQKGNST